MKLLRIIAPLVFLVFLSCQPNQYGDKYRFDQLEIYASGKIEEPMVNDLHEFMKNHNLLTGKHQSIQLVHLEDKYILKLVKSKGIEQLPMTAKEEEAFLALSEALQVEVLNGAICEIHLASNTFKTIQILA